MNIRLMIVVTVTVILFFWILPLMLVMLQKNRLFKNCLKATMLKRDALPRWLEEHKPGNDWPEWAMGRYNQWQNEILLMLKQVRNVLETMGKTAMRGDLDKMTDKLTGMQHQIDLKLKSLSRGYEAISKMAETKQTDLKKLIDQVQPLLEESEQKISLMERQGFGVSEFQERLQGIKRDTQIFGTKTDKDDVWVASEVLGYQIQQLTKLIHDMEQISKIRDQVKKSVIELRQKETELEQSVLDIKSMLEQTKLDKPDIQEQFLNYLATPRLNMGWAKQKIDAAEIISHVQIQNLLISQSMVEKARAEIAEAQECLAEITKKLAKIK